MTSIDISANDVLKYKLQTDLYFFTRYFYKKLTGNNFIRSKHFEILSDVLEKVYTHEITRLIINLPPRHGKTEMAVINFIAKGLMMNPKAKFIHTSYSEALALDNSEKIKEFVQSDEYQQFCPIEISLDSKSKKKWYTDAGGGMMASSSGGQITGFGAGLIGTDEFGGAIIIDDPIKPDDAHSETVRNAINNRFFNTMLSRVNNPKTPIIIIMQRVHKDDLSGVLLKKGGWHHINLPAITKEGQYLWDLRKETVDEVKALKPYVFMAQYQQEPTDQNAEYPFFYGYNEPKHLVWSKYPVDYNRYFDMAFDFNHTPCVAVIGQMDRYWQYHVFDIVMADPTTRAGLSPLAAVCQQIKEKYLDTGLVLRSRMRYMRDASGAAQSADRQESVTFDTTIQNILGLNAGNLYARKANLPHIVSGEIINTALYKLTYYIHDCDLLRSDIKKSFPDKDSSLNEAKKQFGLHVLDAWRYLNDMWFSHDGYWMKDPREILQNIDKICTMQRTLQPSLV